MKTETIQKQRFRGVLTIYMSLMLPILLSIVLALFLGARIRAEKMKVEIVTDIAGNSCLGEYNRELRKQYGLLMVDTAYDLGAPSVANLNDHLTSYLEGNTEGNTITRIGEFLLNTTNYSELKCTSADIPEYSLAGDNNCAVTQRQIFCYMEAEPVEGLLGDADAAIQAKADAQSMGASGSENTILGKISESWNGIRELFGGHSSEELEGNNEDSMGLPPNSETEDTMQSLDGADEDTRSWSVVDLVAPDPSAVSTETFNEGDVFTGRSGALHGTGLDDSFDANFGEQFGLFNLYLFQKFGYYHHEKEDGHLSYQIEYLIGKKNDDKKNLGAVCWWLLAIRCAVNFAYALNESSKPGATIKTICAVIALFPVIGEALAAIVKTLLTAISAFKEARNDVALLLSDGKVPFVKTDASWHTDLWSPLKVTKGSNSTGMTYGQYLLMLMLLHEAVGGINEETRRMMDIMELDIRKVAGYGSFRIDGCLDCFRMNASFDGESGHTYDFSRFFGYEEAPA